MIKNSYLPRKKIILIVIAIVILFIIIALIALMKMYSDKAPTKAVYVFEVLKGCLKLYLP